MRQFDVVFLNNIFLSRQPLDYLSFAVDSYNFSAIGGCDEAVINVSGGELSVWDLANMLRAPVIIYTNRGIRVWWGYVHEITIEQGALSVTVGLDSMINRVAVAYSYVATGSQTVGTRKTTAWADNLDSQEQYGVKALLSSIGGMSDAAADNRRDAIVADRAWPQGGITQNESSRASQAISAKKKLNATLLCRGWWETLGWKYYANTGTTSVATTTQIGAIVTDAGQFLTATDIAAASGISSSEYRDGDTTALAEILSLMGAGGANGRRLLSSIDPNRRVQIWEEPAPVAALVAYHLDSQARLYGPGGTLVNELTPPVGVWCRLKDVIPGVVDLTKLADPSLQFIERASWSAGSGVKYTFRGQPQASNLLTIDG